MSQLVLSIPSPAHGVWYLGPVPIRGYSLCIILGIVVAIWIGERRWANRGGTKGDISDLAIWAIPFGIVGARLYHVITDWRNYFGEDGSALQALEIWNGGLGIWGGIAGGALGVIIGARLKNIRILPVLDTLAPGVLIAQAIGRWGNWFNQELYGKPTDQPWGLEIDSPPVQYAPDTLFHPTFLYESLWALGGFVLLLGLERTFRLGHGRVLAAYVMIYTAGRVWIENLRIDDVQMNDVLGLRLNVWTSIVVFALAAAYFIWSLRALPGRESVVHRGSADAPVAHDGGVNDDGAAHEPATAANLGDTAERPAVQAPLVGDEETPVADPGKQDPS